MHEKYVEIGKIKNHECFMYHLLVLIKLESKIVSIQINKLISTIKI